MQVIIILFYNYYNIYIYILYYLVYGYDQRAEVHTDVGMYSVENLGFTATQIANSKGFTTDNPPDCKYII